MFAPESDGLMQLLKGIGVSLAGLIAEE